MFELDDNGFITSWAKDAENIFGYEEYEALGMHVSLLYAPSELRDRKAVVGLQRTGAHGAHVAFAWHRRKNGQEFWAFSESHLLKDGERLGFTKSVSEWTVGQSASYR